MLSITIVSASTRAHAQSSKIGGYIESRLAQRSEISSSWINFSKHPFPLWDESYWEKGQAWDKGWTSISEQLFASDGFIFVVPEWNGMPPPQLFNMLQLCSNRELWHKPAFLVTVSATLGGTYPLSVLHASSFKNVRLCYVPEHLIIRRAEEVLNHETPQSEWDQEVRDRVEEGISILLAYAEAFKKIRTCPSVLNPKFIHGM